MKDTSAGDPVIFLLLGAAVGAAAALLLAPESGAKTRQRLTRRGEEVSDYLIDTGKELVGKCEDLCERSAELAGDARQELSGKYRALHAQSKQLLEETEAVLRRAGRAVKEG